MDSIVSKSVAVHGFSQLGFRSYPFGTFVPEAITVSLSFLRSDKPDYTIASIRPVGPCKPTSAMAGLFLHQELQSDLGSKRISRFLRTPLRRGGRPYEGIPNLGYLDLFGPPAPYQLFELKAVIAALLHWVSVLQGHQVLIAVDNTTVVSYINNQGGTHSLTLLCLVVYIFMWLQALDIVLRARHIPGCLNIIVDRLSRPNQPISTEWSLNSEIVNKFFSESSLVAITAVVPTRSTVTRGQGQRFVPDGKLYHLHA